MDNKGWSSHVEFAVLLITLIGGYLMIKQDIDYQTARIDSANVRFDQFMVAWHEEAKNFHGRLCSIEEKTKGN